MADCPICGLPYQEGAKVCPACGSKLPVIVKQNTCKICGNTLIEGESFCSVCGTAVNPSAEKDEKKEEEAPKDDFRNPTMDEIQIPVITDDLQALQEKPLTNADTPTMDSIYMPGQEPPKKPAAVPLQKPAAAANTYAQSAPQQAAATVIAPEGVVPETQNSTNSGNGIYGQQSTVVPGKTGSGMLAPIILILLIIAVILFDVFFLFKDQLF